MSQLDVKGDSLMGGLLELENVTLNIQHFQPILTYQEGIIFRCHLFFLVNYAFTLSQRDNQRTTLTLSTM